MTMTRTDIHRPTELTTEDYVYVGGYDNEIGLPGDSPAGANRARLRAAIAASTTTAYHSGSQCDHCGAHIRYVAVVRHTPTGDHLAIGETCLDNRFERATADFQAMRKAAQLDREQQRLVTASNAYRADHDVDWDVLDASVNGFVMDVLAKLRRWGSISDKQLTAIVGAVVRDTQRDADQAVTAVTPSAVAPNADGVTVEGRIVSLKWKDSDYGGAMKMTVVVTTPDGDYRVWGTQPRALEGEWGCMGCGSTAPVCRDGCDSHNHAAGYVGAAAVGDTVRFTANFSQAHDDTSMAFFKRPRKATIVATAPVVDDVAPDAPAVDDAPVIDKEAAKWDLALQYADATRALSVAGVPSSLWMDDPDVARLIDAMAELGGI